MVFRDTQAHKQTDKQISRQADKHEQINYLKTKIDKQITSQATTNQLAR